MTTINAEKISVLQVRNLLNFHFDPKDVSFADLLSLEPLTELETEEISQIKNDYQEYLLTDKVTEGLVKALTTFPLMRLAGFYRPPLKMSLEQNIAEIVIEDEDTTITGRFDILAVNKQEEVDSDLPFWVLIIETKNSLTAPRAGLPQLLTYAYNHLQHQKNVWGLTTNGELYQFVYLQYGEPLTYQLMDPISLLKTDGSLLLLQVLKAICKLQRG
jgi:hypothetical protein